MNNPQLARQLERTPVSLPNGWDTQILSLDTSPHLHEYADAVVHNLKGLKEVGRTQLNAMHIVSICMVTITKMIKANFSGEKVLASYTNAPEYLSIMIPDVQVRHDAIRLFNEEMTQLVSAYCKT